MTSDLLLVDVFNTHVHASFIFIHHLLIIKLFHSVLPLYKIYPAGVSILLGLLVQLHVP